MPPAPLKSAATSALEPATHQKQASQFGARRLPPQIVTLYPGLVYEAQQLADLAACAAPADEAFAPAPPPFTAGNRYLLSQCLPLLPAGRRLQLIVDGRPDALSARRFAAAAELAATRGEHVNTAWLREGGGGGSGGGSDTSAAERLLQQQATVGHLINHPPAGAAATVQFDLCPLQLPPGTPPRLLRFAPTLNYTPELDGGRCISGWPPGLGGCRWVVVQRAAADVAGGSGAGGAAPGPELWMDYGRNPLALGDSP